mgnify:CR=1 FL=1
MIKGIVGAAQIAAKLTPKEARMKFVTGASLMIAGTFATKMGSDRITKLAKLSNKEGFLKTFGFKK